MPVPPPLKKDVTTGASSPPPPPPLPPIGVGGSPQTVSNTAHGVQAAPLEERPRRRGMKHDASHLWTAYLFAFGLAAAGVLGVCPAVYEIVDHLRHADTSPGVARWAYLLILLGVVQLAYAAYVGQLPDWSAIWMATLFTLLLAAMYATLLGFLLLTAEPVQTTDLLQLEEALRPKAVSWCFVMLSVNCLLTYLGGRSAAGWYRSHAVLVVALKRDP